MMVKNAICPVCGKKYSGYPALSRVDNKTEICGECGRWEAMAAYWKYLKYLTKEDGKEAGK